MASFLGGIPRSWAGARAGVKGFCSVCTRLARAPGRPWRGDRRVPPPSRAARRRRIPPPSRAARRRIGGGPAREGGLSPAPFPAPPLGGDGRGGAWGVGEARVRGGCWLPKPGERAGAPERGRAAARERRGGRGPRDATRPARPAGRCKGRRRGPARRARPKRAAGRAGTDRRDARGQSARRDGPRRGGVAGEGGRAGMAGAAKTGAPKARRRARMRPRDRSARRGPTCVGPGWAGSSLTGRAQGAGGAHPPAGPCAPGRAQASLGRSGARAALNEPERGGPRRAAGGGGCGCEDGSDARRRAARTAVIGVGRQLVCVRLRGRAGGRAIRTIVLRRLRRGRRCFRASLRA